MIEPAGHTPTASAAHVARRLSQRATEDLLRRLLAQITEAPARLAALLGEHVEPLLAFTADRRILAANPAAEAFFRHPAGTLRGATTDLLVPARMRQRDAPAMQPPEGLTTIELPGLRGDGSEAPLAWTFGVVPAPAAPVFVLVVRDRAEIDDALEALYASEQRFRLLVDGLRDHAVILLDAEGRVATWNSGAERLEGWAATEIIGQPYATLFVPDERAADVPARHLAAAMTRGHLAVTGWRARKDGRPFFAEASLWPLFTPEGALQGYATITHDLTARRAAEDSERRLEVERAARAAAEAGRDRLARLHRAAQALSRAATPEQVVTAVFEECLTEVDAAGGAVYTLTPDGSALALLGERGHPSAFVQRHARVPLAHDAPPTAALRARAAQEFPTHAELAAAYPAYAADLRAAGFERTIALPLAVRGVALGVLIVGYRARAALGDDERSLLLTMAELCAQALDRARLFEAERRARADAEAASRAKDEFLAMLGHELRNPLAPIATAIDLMKLRGDDRSARERAVIERQLGHITRLVDDLLDVSRITRGKLELAREDLEIADVIARGVEIASPLLEQRGHHLAIEAPRDLRVWGDPARLAQVLANLVTNAAKYTPPGGHIAITAAGSGDDLLVEVRDDGIGIPADLLPEVFDLFVQGKRTFDRSQGGLGIGLALVKNLVAMHGGSVRAASEGAGRGSAFTVRLPRLRPVRATPPSGTPAQPARAGDRKRVLVVDDNRDFADMLAGSLGALGYEVEVAVDGVGALERLRAFPADAAVLDLGLPVIDGFELARRIREQLGSRAPRMIALTGYGQAHDRARSAAVGFAEHLVKPADIAEVIAAIERPAAARPPISAGL